MPMPYVSVRALRSSSSIPALSCGGSSRGAAGCMTTGGRHPLGGGALGGGPGYAGPGGEVGGSSGGGGVPSAGRRQNSSSAGPPLRVVTLTDAINAKRSPALNHAWVLCLA
jgi:hypothetical protein